LGSIVLVVLSTIIYCTVRILRDTTTRTKIKRPKCTKMRPCPSK
jgi:hypothetical protein